MSVYLPPFSSQFLRPWMALRASSVRLSAIIRQRSFIGFSGLGALTIGLAAANWRQGTYARIYPVVTQSMNIIRSVHSTQGLLSALTFTSTNTMHPLTPPQPAPTWTHSAEDVMRLTKEAIADDRQVQNQVAALAPQDCNFSSVSILRFGAEDICTHAKST